MAKHKFNPDCDDCVRERADKQRMTPEVKKRIQNEGFLAGVARIAPFSSVKEVMALLHSEMGGWDGDDLVRAAFDAWLQEIDPEGKMDVYQVARAYQREAATL